MSNGKPFIGYRVSSRSFPNRIAKIIGTLSHSFLLRLLISSSIALRRAFNVACESGRFQNQTGILPPYAQNPSWTHKPVFHHEKTGKPTGAKLHRQIAAKKRIPSSKQQIKSSQIKEYYASICPRATGRVLLFSHIQLLCKRSRSVKIGRIEIQLKPSLWLEGILCLYALSVKKKSTHLEKISKI